MSITNKSNALYTHDVGIIGRLCTVYFKQKSQKKYMIETSTIKSCQYQWLAGSQTERGRSPFAKDCI